MGIYRIPLLHRLDRYPRSVPTSHSIRPASDLSTRERKAARSAPEVVAAQILAVLVVVLAVTSIVGLTISGNYGNAPAAVIPGVIGMSSTVLGLVFGFVMAYQSG
jgi:hypothetical protein